MAYELAVETLDPFQRNPVYVKLLKEKPEIAADVLDYSWAAQVAFRQKVDEKHSRALEGRMASEMQAEDGLDQSDRHSIRQDKSLLRRLRTFIKR